MIKNAPAAHFDAHNRAKDKARGFTMVELAVVILIAGLMLGLAISFAIPIIKTAQRVETEEKIGKISRALHAYAVRNHRLPCPAQPANAAANPPFGFEMGSGAAGDQLPAPDCGANVIGMVPFATLGLNRDMIFDGFDNIITYAISPVFTRDTAADLSVHPACRTIEWYHLVSRDETAGGTLAIYAHKAPRKARFCCPDDTLAAATDLDVRDGANNPVLAVVRSAALSGTQTNTILGGPPLPAQGPGTCPPLIGPDACAGLFCCTGYATVATPFSIAPNAAVHPDDRSSAVAYLLLSHGENGRNAAYNLVTGARPVAAPADPFELENANDDRIFRDVYVKTDTYDDLLHWRTQDMIFAEQGESCVVP